MPIALGGPRTANLHSYWDTGVLQPLGQDPQAIATAFQAQITPKERQAWAAGDAKSWARDSYEVARTVAYALNTPSGCESDRAPITLPAAYQASAQAAASIQLEKAGVRLAWVLNQTLGR